MAKRIPMRPGYEGTREEIPVEIENPYDKGQFVVAVKNVRESSITVMHARGQLDDAQLRAGEWFRSQYERMRMGSMAIDPSYEPVDKSGHADPIPDRVLLASRALAEARSVLGAVAWPVTSLVCGQGYGVTEAAQILVVKPTARDIHYVGRLFRNALVELAVHLGYSKRAYEPLQELDTLSA